MNLSTLESPRREKPKIEENKRNHRLSINKDDKSIGKNVKKNETTLQNASLDYSKDITLEVKSNLREYIADIVAQTGRPIQHKQLNMIEKYLEVSTVRKLNHYEIKASREEFNRKRTQVREFWEMETGQKWPRYEKDVCHNGKVLRRAGQPYDAHHIIENSYGGPHRWWNMHPAAFPSQHQDGIHRDESMCSKLFGPLPDKFHYNKRV